MDNPHAFNKLAYLAGIIDGDGHIRLSVANIKGYKSIIPSIEICNTNEAVVNFCRDIMQEIGVRSNFYVNAKTGGKPYFCTILRSQRRCKKVLEKITPYLVEKKSRAEIVLEFIRLRNKSSRDYTEVEWGMVERFKKATADFGKFEIGDINLSYFAGLIDAEGCISLKGGRPIKHNKRSAINPSIRFLNTNPVLADYAVAVFKSLGVNPHIYSKTLKSGKTFFDITVNGLSKTKRVLENIKELLVAKVSQAVIVLDFIRYRLNLSAQGFPKKPYGAYELGLLNKVQAING